MNEKNIGRFKYFPEHTTMFTSHRARLLDTATGEVWWAGDDGKWRKDMERSPSMRPRS